MKMIDNGLGVGLGMASKLGSPEEYGSLEGHMIGNKIYGESPAHDCP